MSKRLSYMWSPGIRIQLTLWYTLIFALLILLFSFILYMTLQALLSSGVDSALRLRAQQIAGGISNEDGRIFIQDVTGELPGIDATSTPVELKIHPLGDLQTDRSNHSNVPSDVNIGTLVRILDGKGHALYISPAFRALTPPLASMTQPLQGIPWQNTVVTPNGQSVRLYSFALTDNDTIFGVLQVGASLVPLTTTLQSVIMTLLIITPFLLALGAFGSYRLTKRAFKPILRLTHAAGELSAGDLHRRVPIPRAKDEVYTLALTLNKMIERLEQAFTQQRRFVADASHELRTPVAAIRSSTDVALEEPPNLEECVNVLREVNVEAERLGYLINNLLTLARADEEQIPLDHEPVRLDLLTLDVVASMEALAIERGVTLQVQTQKPVSVMGDTARLIQVVMSLVDNALTYTNKGGTVILDVGVSNAHAVISVYDTGIGIAPGDIPHLFERFYRADPARSRVAGGTGLGLSLADWVVRAHGGTITVVSQLGQGSTFTVSLPLALSISREIPNA